MTLVVAVNKTGNSTQKTVYLILKVVKKRLPFRLYTSWNFYSEEVNNIELFIGGF